MNKFKKEDVDKMFSKIDKGIVEYRKARAMDITKSILIGIWTVTIFPLIILWMFVNDRK